MFRAGAITITPKCIACFETSEISSFSCIMKLPVSNISRDSNYPNKASNDLRQFIRTNDWIAAQTAHGNFLPN